MFSGSIVDINVVFSPFFPHIHPYDHVSFVGVRARAACALVHNDAHTFTHSIFHFAHLGASFFTFLALNLDFKAEMGCQSMPVWAVVSSRCTPKREMTSEFADGALPPCGKPLYERAKINNQPLQVR